MAARGAKPLIVTEPETGSITPKTTSARVDLPAPVEPTSATEVPMAAVNEASINAGSCASE